MSPSKGRTINFQPSRVARERVPRGRKSHVVMVPSVLYPPLVRRYASTTLSRIPSLEEYT